MEQEPTPLIELFVLILLLGGVTYFLGTVIQGYILFKNKKPLWIGLVVILLIKLLAVPATLFILSIQHYPFSPVYVSVTAILPETVFSILILKIFGNKIVNTNQPVHNTKRLNHD